MKKESVLLINKYLSDLGVTYIKLHNLHWNVTGLSFKVVHEYLEGLYDDVTAKLDEVAELLKQHEEYPQASLKEYVKSTSIEEIKSKDYSIKEVIEILSKDVQTLKDEASSLREELLKSDTFDIVNVLEDHIASYNKSLWFIKSMLK